MLPPALRRSMRDASWVEAAVTAPTALCESGGMSAGKRARETSEGAGPSAHRTGAVRRKSSRTEEPVEESPQEDPQHGRLSARAFTSRRSMSLFADMDPAEYGSAGMAAMSCTPSRQGASSGNEEMKGPSGSPSTAGALHDAATDKNMPQAEATLPVAVASVKVVCHLTEGLAILVSDGFLNLWLGYLPVPTLCSLLAEVAPAVSLPLPEVLTRLERCATPIGADATEERFGEEAAVEEEGNVTVHVSRIADRDVFTQRDLSERRTGSPPPPPPPASVEVRLSSPVTVLRGYKIPLEVPVMCTRLPSHQERQHDAPSSWTCEDVFLEMVFEPQQAHVVALSEAVLLLCAESGRAPASVATHMSDVYQQRYQAAVRAAQTSRTPEDNFVSTSVVWQAHRRVSSALIHALQMAPALHGIHGFATDLLRFAKGEANRLVEGPNGTVMGVEGHETDLPSATEVEGTEKTAQALSTLSSAAPASSLSRVATTATDAIVGLGQPATPSPSHQGGSITNTTTPKTEPPLAVSLAAPMAGVTAGAQADAEKKRKKLRKLFS